MQKPKLTSGALPLVGHLFDFIRKQDELLQRGKTEHGNIFALNLMGKNVAVLTGAEAKKVFFKETDKTLNMEEGYEFLAAIFGKVAFLADHSTYMNHRPILHALFSRARMTGYLDVMVEVVSEWMDGLGENGEMEIGSEMIDLVKEVAGRSFLGAEINKQLGADFWQAYDDLSKALDPVLPPHWPLPKFIRRDRAKKYVSSVLYPIVRERRANPQDDPFQMLVDVRMKDGELPSEEIIVQLLMALLFAGHETTAGQAAWTVIQLAQHPRYLKLVRAEVDGVLGKGQDFDHTTLRNLSHVSMAVDETSRMRPSAETIMRTAESDLPVGDFIIPKGWMVQTATAVDHFMGEVFDQPDLYDPLRFSPERAEQKLDSHAIIAFGGGLHKCAGMNFANTEMAVITALLFRNYDLELITPETQVERGLGSSRPSQTWVRFKRRDK
ncbi:MAG: cytochrome P450 [Anaerolineae bacterium]|jgi:sterol 14alpha-demethylase|nr:cytochrome P450 [Anaerolineae bacterium]MBT7070283.1 cytochrome P450 [Anaerolineae bacterium]MBT7325486.1 cytochrome P450 [Anaerolineae bacterium]